ncbi:MAG: 50S ribosomal protein L11 methyltransferase [Proteobacteria bacterium]|nr:50S ribosomal protein L11 methyltransferase [Pseudomonadota bacterium]MBU0967867.1 50S ribosomal protein L11 methyltransferase [Pseudomonadota bacterium]
MNDPFNHRQPQHWLKCTIEIDDELADMAAAFVADVTGKGVEQSMAQPDTDSTATTVTAYLDNDEQTPAIKEKIRTFLKQLCRREPVIRYEEIVEEDWGVNWKKHFKPAQVSRRITVKPTWEPYQAGKDEIVIEIDPGLAFGTGLHASTRLALQLIESAFTGHTAPHTVLDVGTGTGILGIAAALFGAAKVMGIDNDSDAVVCATDNVEQNRVSRVMSVSGADLGDQTGHVDLVIANITSDVLTQLAPQLVSRVAPTGQLILAGILAGEQGQGIEQTFTSLGLKLLASPVEGEWQAFLFTA